MRGKVTSILSGIGCRICAFLLNGKYIRQPVVYYGYFYSMTKLYMYGSADVYIFYRRNSFIYPFIQPVFTECLLSLGTVLSAENRTVNSTKKISAVTEFIF